MRRLPFNPFEITPHDLVLMSRPIPDFLVELLGITPEQRTEVDARLKATADARRTKPPRAGE